MIESLSPEACRIRNEALERYARAKKSEPAVHELELEARRCDELAQRADQIAFSTLPGVSDETRTMAAKTYYAMRAKAADYRARLPR